MMSDKITADTDKERELVRALKGAHRAIDSLLAMLIARDPTFMPTRSKIWLSLTRAADLLRQYGEL